MRLMKIPRDDLAMLCRDIQRVGGRLKFSCRLRGTSMQPSLNDGDTLIVETRGQTELVNGDIIVYRNKDGVLVAHRLVDRHQGKSGTLPIARSDAPGARDEIVSPEDVLGKMIDVQAGPITAKLRVSAGELKARVTSAMWSIIPGRP